MNAGQQFVADAREKGKTDDEIKDMLKSNGWTDAHIAEAFSELAVPLPPSDTTPVTPVQPIATSAAPVANGRPSISALEAALHHVLLWVFTATSTIMISIVAATLFGSASGSSDSLLTYVVMETVTFLPFLALFVYYLRQQKKRPELTTGKIWSIITIVLHSVGAMGSIIGFILVLVLVDDGNTASGLAAFGAIGIMNILVVAAYVMANFTKSHDAKLHRRILVAFPIALAVLIAIFGILALMKVGPLRADDQTRQNLVTTVESVHSYAESNKKLPASGSQVPELAKGVTYTKISASSYKVCATFQHDAVSDYGGSNYTLSDDSYTSKYQFENNKEGETCWTVTNYTLKYDNNDSTVDCNGYNYSSSACRSTTLNEN